MPTNFLVQSILKPRTWYPILTVSSGFRYFGPVCYNKGWKPSFTHTLSEWFPPWEHSQKCPLCLLQTLGEQSPSSYQECWQHKLGKFYGGTITRRKTLRSTKETGLQEPPTIFGVCKQEEIFFYIILSY